MALPAVRFPDLGSADETAADATTAALCRGSLCGRQSAAVATATMTSPREGDCQEKEAVSMPPWPGHNYVKKKSSRIQHAKSGLEEGRYVYQYYY